MAATERRLGLYIVNGKANHCVVVVLGASPRAAQGLLLALKLSITSGGVQVTIYYGGNKIYSVLCKASALLLYYHTSPQINILNPTFY